MLSLPRHLYRIARTVQQGGRDAWASRKLGMTVL
jgi:hypothetical protein